MVAAAALLTGTVAKTPPGSAAAELLGDGDAAGDPDPDPDPEDTELPPRHVPTGGPRLEFVPGVKTTFPGFGN